MTQTDDGIIRAKVLRHLHRKGRYKPHGHLPVDAAATAVPTHDRGQAKALVHEMAQDDSSPLVYHVVGETVALRKDEEAWVANAIRRNGGEKAVPWDLEQFL